MSRKMSVLIVDDEPLVARSVSRYLQKNGYDTEVCDGGTMAIEKLGNRHFDILITDLELPDLHGTALIEHVAKSDSVCRVIVISGHAVMRPLKQYNSLNISYIHKPFDLEHLLEHVRGTFSGTSPAEKKPVEYDLLPPGL
jgi:DNA-binding NtrC family response regulator